MFFASDWSAKEGPTHLPHSASRGSTFKKIFTYFSGKLKVVWVIIELEYFDLEDSESKIKAKPQVKPDSETKVKKKRVELKFVFFY
jgi:hypothetical protein